MDDKRSEVFNAHQGKFGSQWLNVVELVQVSEPTFVLRIRATVVKVERDGLHGLSCTKSASRFSRHATLNSLMKQTLGSLDSPSVLEPRGLYRTEGKRPDGVTMIPWEMVNSWRGMSRLWLLLHPLA